jgi:arabinofuranan 3-O-arabinosyltransferase
MGRWVEAAGAFMTNPFVLICSFSVVALSLVGVMWIKHPYRLHVILLMIVGLGVSVGGAPQDSPGPYGWLFQRFTETDAGLAMRSTPRAAPLLLIGMAIGFATVYVWFRDRFTGKQRLATHVVAATLIAINGFPFLTGDLITGMYRYKEVRIIGMQSPPSLIPSKIGSTSSLEQTSPTIYGEEPWTL